MSFAEGFGESFSKSFDASVARNAQERQDQFKMIYEEYLHRRQMVDEQKMQDTKLANSAKALVQQFGGTVDPRAWTWVYNQKVGGASDESIIDQLHRGKFTFSDPGSTSTQAPPDSGTQTPSAVSATPSNDGAGGDNSMNPGGDDVNVQTTKSGLAPTGDIPPSGNGPVPPENVGPQKFTGVGATAQTGAAMGNTAVPQAPTPPPAPVAPPSPHVRADQTAPLPGTLAHAAAKTMPAPAPQAPQPNVSADMSQSSSQVSQSPMPQAVGAAPQGTVSTNPVRGFMDKMYNDRMARNTELAKSRIAGASGLAPGQVDQIMSQVPTAHIEDTSNMQFTPGPVRDKTDEAETLDQISQARANAESRGDKAAVKMLDTKYAAEVAAMKDSANVTENAKYDAEIRPAQDALVSKMGDTVQAHRDRVAAVNNAVQDYNIMSDAVEKTNGDVLSEPTAIRSDKAQEMLRDITTTVKQGFDSMGKGGVNVPQSAQNVVNQLEAYRQKLTAPGGNGLDNLAVQRGLFDIQKALFAFHLAQAEALRAGNRGLSVDQLNSIQNLTTNALNPDEFHQGMADALGNALKSVEQEGQETIASNPDITNWKQQRGFVPPALDYDLIKKQDQAAIQSNPDLVKGYARLQQYSRDNPDAKVNQNYGAKNVIQNQVAPNQGTASTNTNAPPALAVDFLKKNPQLRAAFDQKYGPGASDKVLGAQQ